MDPKLIERIKKDLLERREKIEAALSRFTTKNPYNKDNFDTTFPSFGEKTDENAAEVATYVDHLTLERNLESTLRDINNTLKRIEEGNYGICRYCHKEIDAKRLLARPTSSACVECKEKFSQQK